MNRLLGGLNPLSEINRLLEEFACGTTGPLGGRAGLIPGVTYITAPSTCWSTQQAL
ncbi:MAG: hypothetical protein QOG10_5338 [Kribbellaceae bacterium]|nr:hypothetical protein [Kribbellaceae bacterium]